MSTTRKFWLLDYDPEGEIYENVAWDLPGFRPSSQLKPKRKRRANFRRPR